MQVTKDESWGELGRDGGDRVRRDSSSSRGLPSTFPRFVADSSYSQRNYWLARRYYGGRNDRSIMYEIINIVGLKVSGRRQRGITITIMKRMDI
jgi:hypothetical protein